MKAHGGQKQSWGSGEQAVLAPSQVSGTAKQECTRLLPEKILSDSP